MLLVLLSFFLCLKQWRPAIKRTARISASKGVQIALVYDAPILMYGQFQCSLSHELATTDSKPLKVSSLSAVLFHYIRSMLLQNCSKRLKCRRESVHTLEWACIQWACGALPFAKVVVELTISSACCYVIKIVAAMVIVIFAPRVLSALYSLKFFLLLLLFLPPFLLCYSW